MTRHFQDRGKFFYDLLEDDPNTPRCPRCRSDDTARQSMRMDFYCYRCRLPFTRHEIGLEA